METSEQPPDDRLTPEINARPDEAPRPRDRRRPPHRGAASLIGTLLFVLCGILAVFAIGAGGIGLLLMLIFEAAWPLAAPGILLYVIAICLPAGLVIWMRKRSGSAS